MAERHSVLRVPNQALRYRPGGFTGHGQANPGQSAVGGASPPGQARVFVLRDGKPTRISVTTGLADDAFTEVTGGDLRRGDAVITSEAGAASGAGSRWPITLRF